MSRPSSSVDSLVYLPQEKWHQLQDSFKNDWPRCISGYTLLKTQKLWRDMGIEHTIDVYCPFGNIQDGMVGINAKIGSYNILVMSTRDDTSTLEEALKLTKRIEWDKQIVVPFAPLNIIKCLQKVCNHKRLDMAVYPGESFYLDPDRKEEFSDVSLPPDLTYKPITPENIELIESKWPHKYSNADWYFNLLLKAKSGFGLYKDGELVSWVFHNEAGNLAHMYTIEEHRRKGYAVLLLNKIAKLLLSEDKHVVAYCVKGNENAVKMYKKFGFRTFDDVAWLIIKPHQGADEKELLNSVSNL